MVLEWQVLAEGLVGGKCVKESDCIEALEKLLKRKVVSLLSPDNALYQSLSCTCTGKSHVDKSDVTDFPNLNHAHQLIQMNAAIFAQLSKPIVLSPARRLPLQAVLYHAVFVAGPATYHTSPNVPVGHCTSFFTNLKTILFDRGLTGSASV